MNLYFNNAFSRQPLTESIQRMLPFLQDHYENPLTESEGAELVRQEMERARGCVAALINASSDEIYFVSSGTEANNWALKGAALANPKKNHVVVSAIEHFSVYQAAQVLQRQNCEVTFVSCDASGFIDFDEVKNAIRPSTALVSIQCGSDEIGVIQNIDQIASLKSQYPDLLFHSDAVQYLCYEDLPLDRIALDLVSLSSNALYGPPGIASLFVRKGTRILPLLHGGMQEDGMRPGLQSTALIAGFGEAARVNKEQKREWKQKLASMQEKLFQTFDSLDLRVTGSRTCRLVDNVHVVTDVDGEAFLTLLAQDGIAASSGSTCYQYAQKESHVLKALGLPLQDARGSLLFTPGKDQETPDMEILLEAFQRSLKHLRSIRC